MNYGFELAKTANTFPDEPYRIECVLDQFEEEFISVNESSYVTWFSLCQQAALFLSDYLQPMLGKTEEMSDKEVFFREYIPDKAILLLDRVEAFHP